MSKLNNINIDNKYIVRDSSTSDGSQIKYHFDNKWYKIDNFGGEAETEALTSMLLECSNLDSSEYVHYQKTLINGDVGCYSEDFRTNPETDDFVTLYRLYKNIYGRDLAQTTSRMDYDDAILYVIEFVKKNTGLDITTYLANTFYLDEIILNTDRHFNNYGLIISGESYSLSPIFDNGKSLLTGCKLDSESTPLSEAIKKVYSKSFSPDFRLNSKFLRDHRTLIVDKVRIMDRLNKWPESIQKQVLMMQIEKLIL